MVMNINRSSMADFGFSPPTRVFEIAGAGTCRLCDDWPGNDDCFAPREQIIVIGSAEDGLSAIDRYDAGERKRICEPFHRRALRDRTHAQRAQKTEQALAECLERRNPAVRRQDYLLEERA